MTTAYGTTTFVYGDNGNQRYLQATDPLGHTERLEYRQQAPGIPITPDPANTVPNGILAPHNRDLYARNTFYWDKHVYPIAAGDYTKARNKHWTHDRPPHFTLWTGDTVESIKYPLENRFGLTIPVNRAPELGEHHTQAPSINLVPSGEYWTTAARS